LVGWDVGNSNGGSLLMQRHSSLLSGFFLRLCKPALIKCICPLPLRIKLLKQFTAAPDMLVALFFGQVEPEMLKKKPLPSLRWQRLGPVELKRSTRPSFTRITAWLLPI
jgi:hypothetical protein